MEERRWASAVTQAAATRAGEVSAAELHAPVRSTIERLDPALRAAVIPRFERAGEGVQIEGRRGGDEVLLRLAEDLRTAADWTGRRPPIS